MIILVTGSSGFVGETLIPKLQSLGHQIIGIDHSDGQYTTKNIDISKIESIEEIKKALNIKQAVETISEEYKIDISEEQIVLLSEHLLSL